MEKITPNDQLQTHGFCIVNVGGDDPITYNPVSAQYSLIALCKRGSIDYEVNMERVHVEAGMRVCYQNVVQYRRVRQSADLEVRALVLRSDFSFDATGGIETNMVRAMVENPVAPIVDEHALAMLDSMMDALEHYCLLPPQYADRQMSLRLVYNIILLLAEMQLHAQNGQSSRALYTMADTYFRTFINLVGSHVRTEHEVLFYAEQLHITPKYLSEICKQKTGRKAKEIISAVLLRGIKNDLLVSGKSMKMLASEYGFADQSSLGKFFRKMTGLSPLHYKKFESGIKEKDSINNESER